MRFFSIDRIKEAIDHLSNYNSTWLLPSLVLACNGVNKDDFVNLSKAAGTDKFLNHYFSGDLIGLPSFKNANSLRPRFSDLMGTLRGMGKSDDFVLHQNTKLWANAYSSRGYREMVKAGQLETGKTSEFRLSPLFREAFEREIPVTFKFEELLVWLYAFQGFADSISGWNDLYVDFQEQWLGKGNRFSVDFLSRFRIDADGSIPWPVDLPTIRYPDLDYQKALLPSSFIEPLTFLSFQELLAALANSLSEQYEGLNEALTNRIATDIISGLGSTKRLFVLGDPGVGKTKLARIIGRCFEQVFGEDRVLFLEESVSDRTTPESLIGYASVGGDWIFGSITTRRPDGRALLYLAHEIDNPSKRNQINIVLLDEANRRDIEALTARLQNSLDSQIVEPRDPSHIVNLDSAGSYYLSPFTYLIMTGNSPRDDDGRVNQSRPFRRRPNLIIMPNVLEYRLRSDDTQVIQESLVRFWRDHCQLGLIIEDKYTEAFESNLASDAEFIAEFADILRTLSDFRVGISFGVVEKFFRTSSLNLALGCNFITATDNGLASSFSPLLATDRCLDGKSIKTVLFERHGHLQPKYPAFLSLTQEALTEDSAFGVIEPFF